MLPVKTGFWGLSQRLLLCFVDDDHKGKSYSGYTGKCERWLVFVCVCVGVMWIWPFVKIEQHIFRTSLLKILGCIHSVSRISLSVWWNSCLPHCTTYRLDRLEAYGWNKNSPICVRNPILLLAQLKNDLGEHKFTTLIRGRRASEEPLGNVEHESGKSSEEIGMTFLKEWLT